MSGFFVREIRAGDLTGLLELYTQLHENPMPALNNSIRAVFDAILKDKNHHILLGCIHEKIVSSCVLVIVQNLTHFQRPYALIENVVTSEAFRNKGYATRVLQFAKQIAFEQNCYKIMLLTGSKEESTWRFYEAAGYNRNDKTAFIQWL